MQINDSMVHISFEAYAQKSREADGSPERTPAASGEGPAVDKVVLSPKAREISEARKRLDDLPDVDATRVNGLRLRVEAGLYETNGRQIAEGLLREMTLNATE